MGSETDSIGEITRDERRIFRTISIGLFLLGVSPIGIVAPFILFSLVGICKGGIDLGIQCQVPVIGSYIEGIGGIYEVSFIFLIGIFWAIAAFVIWIMFAVFVGLTFMQRSSTKVDEPTVI